MDIKFWIWLIVIVVTLIVRARNKQASGGRKPGQRQPEPEPEESTKPMSFEELLREIQASKTPPAKPIHVPVSHVPREEAESLERTDYGSQRQEQYEIYEKAKREAFFRPSLEETLKLEDTVVRFGQFKSYQRERPRARAAEFANEIRTGDGFRKAFIMSEILNRRF